MARTVHVTSKGQLRFRGADVRSPRVSLGGFGGRRAGGVSGPRQRESFARPKPLILDVPLGDRTATVYTGWNPLSEPDRIPAWPSVRPSITEAPWVYPMGFPSIHKRQEEFARRVEEASAAEAQRQPTPSLKEPRAEGSEVEIVGDDLEEADMPGTDWWDPIIDFGLDVGGDWFRNEAIQRFAPTRQVDPSQLPVPMTTGGGGASVPPVPTTYRDGNGDAHFVSPAHQAYLQHGKQHRRRRRRRLLTDTDFDDLLRIATLPKTQNIQIALSKAIRR